MPQHWLSLTQTQWPGRQMVVTNSPQNREPTAEPGPSLSVRTLSSTHSAEALGIWQSLEQQLGYESLAVSSLWTENWIRHYGDLVPHEYLIGEIDAEPCGICLLTHGRCAKLGPLAVRSVHLGTAGEPDADSVFVEHNRLLVEPGRQAEFSREIVGFVNTSSDWDQFQLDGFGVEEAAPVLELLPEAVVQRRPAPYFDLRNAREEQAEILSHLGRSTRGNIRRGLRDCDDLRTEWVDSLDRAEEVFSELVTLHQSRWTAAGEPGAFASRRFHDFQLDLIARGLLDGRVVLFRVRQGTSTLGCLLLLVDRNRLLDYTSGFASFEKNRSPGLIVHFLCMQEALQRGYDAYDFLVGEHRHKRNLSNATGELVWARCRRDRWKFRAASAVKGMQKLLPRQPLTR